MERTKDYSEDRYGMGLNLQTTEKHPYGKGAERLSIEELVERGRRYKGGQSYKMVAKQLQQLGNIENNEKFKEAAAHARQLAHKHHEYKSDR